MLHSGGTSQSFFLGNLNKRAKVIVLQIKGLANQVSESPTAVVLYPEKRMGSLAMAYLPVPFHFCPNYHPSLNYLLL